MDEVVRTLRSCLISSKGGIKLNNVWEDYCTIAGEPLPFKKFGFSSVETFIRNVPDIMVTNKNGELYVEATPSKTTAHLTKLISRQVSRQRTRRKIRPQAKKRSPPRYIVKSYAQSFKNNGSQIPKNSYKDSFTRSTPGSSNLYTDFSRPMPMPLMENIIQCPFPRDVEKPRFVLDTPPVSPSKRLKDKISLKEATLKQNLESKTMGELENEILIGKTASSVINSRQKTVQVKSSKLSERLKASSTLPSTQIYNTNNSYIDSPIISNMPQTVSVDASDPRKELEVRANALNLSSPVYKNHIQKAKDSAKITIYASVKVGTQIFSTYPTDAGSEEEAEKMAARLALMNLAKESSSPNMTIDVKLVKERILSIITRHHSGVFMHELPMYYNKQYKEALPHNWQKIVEGCPDINQEKGVGDSIIICCSVSISKRPEVCSPFREIYPEINSSSNEKIQLNPIGPAVPDKLKVPQATHLNVCTTCVISTIEIWVRLVDNGHNDNFVDMMNEMTEYYNQLKEPVSISTCVIGDFYAIFEDNYWHRVQCIDFESDTEIAIVLFIDEGYEDKYKRDVLYSLEKQFCILPAQAIRVALLGLEDFRDCIQTVTEIESYLLDRVFCVRVHSIDSDENGSYAMVTFYDMSREDGIDMNKILFDKILDNITTSSKMHAGELVELYVMHIDQHGQVYAQLNSLAKVCLQNLLNNETMSQISVNVMKSSLVEAIDFTKMYFVLLKSQWYRARVMKIHDEYEVTVFLIDVGRTVMTLKGNLLHMDKISKVLQSLPPQALQIFLHNIDQSMYGEKFVVRFNELVSDTDLLLAKIVKVTMAGIPVVEIFKRIEPNNMLASINTSLIYDEELTKSNEDGNNNIKPKKRLERRNSRILESFGKLNPPMIPDIGQYFDVHVILAAHPGHFIVQPLNDASNLKAMMLDLQKCCDAYEGPQLESIGEGKLYAGKFEDNYWYRVYITNIISENMVSVYFCDFGDVTLLPRSNLQPLRSEFLELPYQAVKAKLIGIQPMNTDWSVEDCLRFQDLVLNKNFVSIVVESIFDHFSPANSTVLGLRLIDVSTDKDVFIDKLLVDENRAKFIEENLPFS